MKAGRKQDPMGIEEGSECDLGLASGRRRLRSFYERNIPTTGSKPFQQRKKREPGPLETSYA